MRSVGSAHIEGDLGVKTNREAAGEFISAQVKGDVNVYGDSQLAFKMNVKSGTFTGTFNFELRQVNSVSYSQNPFTGEWQVDENTDVGTKVIIP